MQIEKLLFRKMQLELKKRSESFAFNLICLTYQRLNKSGWQIEILLEAIIDKFTTAKLKVNITGFHI